jgi:hypothetical protein
MNSFILDARVQKKQGLVHARQALELTFLNKALLDLKKNLGRMWLNFFFLF